MTDAQGFEFLERLKNYTVVGSTLNTLERVYGRVPVLPRLLEGTTTAVRTRATPLIEAHQATLKTVDSFACANLDRLENAVDVPLKHVTAAGSRVVSELNQKATVLRAIQTRAVNMLSQNALDTAIKVETTVTAVTDRLTEVADVCVDTILPPAGQEAQKASETATPAPESGPAAPKTLGSETAKSIDKVRAVSSKAGSRVLQQVTQQLQSFGVVQRLSPYTDEALAYLQRLQLLQRGSAPSAPADTAAGVANVTSTPPVSRLSLGGAKTFLLDRSTMLREQIAQLAHAASSFATEPTKNVTATLSSLSSRGVALEQHMLLLTCETLDQHPHLRAAAETLTHLPGYHMVASSLTALHHQIAQYGLHEADKHPTVGAAEEPEDQETLQDEHSDGGDDDDGQQPQAHEEPGRQFEQESGPSN